MTSNSVYKIITDEIIKKLESVNHQDFEKPWFNIGVSPFNAISKKAYRGLNYVTLGANGHTSKAYASYKQWSEKGCQVRKGEKSHIAVFWLIGEHEKEGKKEKSFLLRYYRVFNSEQVEGDFARKIEQEKLAELKDLQPIPTAQEIVENYMSMERLPLEQSDIACYSRSTLSGREAIHMPLIGQFKDQESYYATFFHELGHSTGAEKRLKRDMSGGFGSKTYAQEELVAELTAAMLCGSIGLTNKPRIDHVQYIKSWLQCMKNDNRFIISAASQAQKAADYIQAKASEYKTWKETQPLLIAAE